MDTGGADNRKEKQRSKGNDEAVLHLDPLYGRFNVVGLLPYLTECTEDDANLLGRPSVYNNEMQLSTEQRIKKQPLLHGRRQHWKRVFPQPESFKISPRFVVFQNFKPGQSYSATLSVMNSSQVMQPLQVHFDPSPYFTSSYKSGFYVRIAPGMSTVMTIYFRPNERRDICHKISFSSHGNKFSVPIIAIGPRPLLDFPDTINIPPMPVKKCSIHTLIVRNSSDIPAVYSLACRRPFTVEPSKGILRPSEIMHVKISATCMKAGNVVGDLDILFDTGEKLCAKINASAEEISIKMNKNCLIIEDTFVGLERKSTILLSNDSEHMVSYKWRKMASREDEDLELEKLKLAFDSVHEKELNYQMDPTLSAVLDPEIHREVCKRIRSDQMKLSDSENFAFNDPSFQFIPMNGILWPNSTTSIIVLFKPQNYGKQESVAYCDVSGCEKRFALSLQGNGLGPNFSFNFNEFNTGVIFAGVVHNYEIVVKNTGHIPGTLSLHSTDTKNGGQFICMPNELHLKPAESGVLIISFSSGTQGEFLEEISFKAQGSGEILKISFQGKVVCASLEFNAESLEFGDVAFGFPISHLLIVQNLSMIPAHFIANIPEDGFEQSVNYEQFADSVSQNTFPTNPKEFSLSPSEGTIPAFGCMKIKITLTPNIIRSGTVSVEAMVVGSLEPAVSIPITYNVILPAIESLTQVVYMRFCFLNIPYTRKLTVRNSSTVPGYFTIAAEEMAPVSGVVVSPSITRSIVKPMSNIDIPFSVITNTIGKVIYPIQMHVMGETSPQPLSKIICVGQGPVLSTVKSLDFGEIKVFESVTKLLTLTNESPVPALFSTKFDKSKHLWTIYPQMGTIEPETNMILDVTISVSDAGVYDNRLAIDILTGKTLHVNLTARAVGTSLEIKPNLCPVLDFGTVLTKRLIEKNFIQINRGTKHHKILWSSLPIIKDMARASRDSKGTSENTIFQIIPKHAELVGGEEIPLVVHAYCEKVRRVTEEFYCHGNIDYSGKRHVLLRTKIIANFIEPKVLFSKPALNFLANIGAEDTFMLIEENVDAKNMTDLSYHVQFKIDFPFKLLGSDGPVSCLSAVFGGQKTISLRVLFDTSQFEDLYSKKVKGFLRVYYEEHSHKDSLPLYGEVNFPSVKVISDPVDFGIAPVGVAKGTEVEMVNSGLLPVKFTWHWLDEFNFLDESETRSSNDSGMACDNADECTDSEISDMACENRIDELLYLQMLGSKTERVRGPFEEGDDKTKTESMDQSVQETRHDQNKEEIKEEPKGGQKKKQKYKLPKLTIRYLRHIIREFLTPCKTRENVMEFLLKLPPKILDRLLTRQVFEMIPFRGELEPFETQIISLGFGSDTELSKERMVICKIDGGRPQILRLKGTASSLSYSIDRSIIDLGYKVFCRPCKSFIRLMNTGYLKFHYAVEPQESIPPSNLQKLLVEPKEGDLEGKGFVDIRVQYFPGQIKMFEHTISLEVGFLEPITIYLKCNGALPQIYPFLPHPPNFSLSPSIGYKVVGSLTSDEYRKSKNVKALLETSDISSLFNENILDDEIQLSLKDDWVVISHKDDYPTLPEIDLLAEKFIAIDHFQMHPLIPFQPSPKSRSMPNLVFPPYYIDLGIVITNHRRSYSVLFYNFGPLPVEAKITHTFSVEEMQKFGFTFHPCDLQKLHVNETGAFYLHFHPCRKDYPKSRYDISYSLFLKVSNGASIPIEVHGIVTVPYLIPSQSCLKFGDIKCGEAKVLLLTLKNEGLVTCVWSGKIHKRFKKKKEQKHKGLTEKEDNDELHKSVFKFHATQNKLAPRQCSQVEICFQPNEPGYHEGTFIITYENNTDVLTIPLCGVAKEHSLSIVNPELEFMPILPYSVSEELLLTIINPCVFPIEVYFPDFDREVFEEEKIIRALCKYYGVDHLCLPIRNPGEKLPNEIYDFYETLLSALYSVLKETEACESIISTLSGLSLNMQSAKRKSELKKVQRKKSASAVVNGSRKSHTTEEHDLSSRKIPSRQASSNILRTLSAMQNLEDIEELLYEHMENIREEINKRAAKEEAIEKAARYAISGSLKINTEKMHGKLVIFFGAPFTDYLAIAHEVAKALNMPVLNIDHIILEAAFSQYSPEAIAVHDFINMKYQEYPLESVSLKSISTGIQENNEEEAPDVHPVEDILTKFESLCQYTEMLRAGTGSNKPVTKATGRGGTISQTNSRNSIRQPAPKRAAQDNPLAGIPVDSLTGILKSKLRTLEDEGGIVVDSLSSSFTPTGIQSLSILIHALENTRVIQCIVLQDTFESYCSRSTDKLLSTAEIVKEDEIRSEQILKTMPIEEVEELCEDEQILHREFIMARRRAKLQEKTKKKGKAPSNTEKGSGKPPKTPTSAKKKDKKHLSKDGSQTDSQSKKKEKKSKLKDAPSSELLAIKSSFASFEAEMKELLGSAEKADLRRGEQPISTGGGPDKISEAIPGRSVQHITKFDQDILVRLLEFSNPNVANAESVVKLLQETSESECNSSIEAKEPPSFEYRLVPCPDRRKRADLPNIFVMSHVPNQDMQSSADQEPYHNARTDELPKEVRNRASLTARSRTTAKKSPSVTSPPTEVPEFQTRWILKPGEESKISIKFLPVTKGDYAEYYALQVVGHPKRYSFTIRGTSDVPRIDKAPAVIYPAVSPGKDSNMLYRLVYFLDKEYFDFGAVISTKMKDKSLRHVAAVWNISNISPLTAHLQFQFYKKNYDKVDTFSIDPTTLTVEPGCTENVVVSASPHRVGEHKESIIISIKDNPAVDNIKIACTGIKIEFDVEPKEIVFDHVLLFHKDCRIVKLKNKSPVPVLWRMTGLNAFVQDFEVNLTEGIIAALDEQEVCIDFYATELTNFVKKPIKLEVYDEEGRGDVLYEDTILVSAESVNIMVDMTFSNTKDNYLNFGAVNVGRDVVEHVYLSNKGKYNVQYKIETDFPPGIMNKTFSKMFSANPVSGKIPVGGKEVAVNIICFPYFETTFSGIPIFKCLLMDNDTVVAVIPIQATILTCYCQFKVQPLDLDFGVLPVGTKKTMSFQIKNTGLFDINYKLKKKGLGASVESSRLLLEESKLSQDSKNEGTIGSRASDHSKLKTKKVEGTSLSLGVFSLTPVSENLSEKQTTSVNVTCYIEEEGSFSEIAFIHVPGSNPELQESGFIQLIARGCVPCINFDDIDDVFQEHLICQNLQEIECPIQIKDHCVFVKEENKFVFRNTCIDTKTTVRIKLRNPCFVNCDISVSIPNSSKSYDKNEEIFTSTPEKFTILPYSTQYLELSFTPKRMEVYNCDLELKVDQLTDVNKKKYSVKLEGEGCAPLIVLKRPGFNNEPGHTEIKFPPTLLGKCSLMPVELQNIGLLPGKVVLKLSQIIGCFSILPGDNIMTLVEDDAIPNTLILTMPSEYVATLNISFIPIELGDQFAEIRATVIGNPYEKITVSLSGRGYKEDVILESRDLFTNEIRHVSISSEKNRRESVEKVNSEKSHYTLEMGYCCIAIPKTRGFKIRNHSGTNIYRFELFARGPITLLPQVGHLLPNASKEITVTFSPTEETNVSQVLIACYLDSIRYDLKIGYSWDERQTKDTWIRGKAVNYPKFEGFTIILGEEQTKEGYHRKTVKVLEPEHTVIQGESYVLYVAIKGVLGYADYHCDVSTYRFPDTLVYHNRTSTFTVRNTGKVPIPYCWNVCIEDNYPARPNISNVLLINGEDGDSLINEEVLDNPSSRVCFTSPNMQIQSLRSLRWKTLGELVANRYKRNIRPSVEPIGESKFQVYCGHNPTTKRDGGGDNRRVTDEELYSNSNDSLERSVDTWIDTDYTPFDVAPWTGMLDPGKEQEFTITFFPLDNFAYVAKLKAKIQGLNPQKEPLNITVKAQSLMPLCHFEIEESDYLSAGRRDESLPGPVGHSAKMPLDPLTKAIEFRVIGVGDTHKIQFAVINPTAIDYDFYWENKTQSTSQDLSLFHCGVMDGHLRSGDGISLFFAFTALKAGVVEEFWTFKIPVLKIEVPFLIVGNVKEPSVCFLKSHVVLCSTTIGNTTQANVSLVNNEDIPTEFSFEDLSLYKKGRLHQLNIEPLSGEIPAKNETSIKIHFTPKHQGSFSFNSKCNIKGMMKPLNLIVTGECFAAHPHVTCELRNGKVQNLQPHVLNTIVLGEVSVNSAQTLQFNLKNLGKMSFYYLWVFRAPSGLKYKIVFREKSGRVRAESQMKSIVTFTPQSQCELNKFYIRLQISKGPSYQIEFRGKVIRPCCSFSFREFNFGRCFCAANFQCTYKTSLFVKNSDSTPLQMECGYENKEFLTLKNANATIEPNGEYDILITFKPRDAIKYKENVEFTLNGWYKVTVIIEGEGILLKVRLQHAKDKCVTINPVQPGRTGSVLVPVINESKIPVTVTFGLANIINEAKGLNDERRSTIGSRKSQRSSDTSTLDQRPNTPAALEVCPSTPVVLKSKERVNVRINFSPLTRMPLFAEKVFMMFCEHIEPLCIVQASCIGPEFVLDRDTIPFGETVQGSTARQMCMLANNGEFGAKFHWKPGPWSECFRIIPEEGYSAPGSEIVFTVEFSPSRLGNIISSTAECIIHKYKRLNLVLRGSCIRLPAPIADILFSAPVRSTDKQTIELVNKYGMPWNLSPQFNGDYFEGPDNIVIAPFETLKYEITFAPLKMSMGTEKFLGCVLFSLPEGGVLRYKLIGDALPPECTQRIVREIKCKELFTEVLPVENWLREYQRLTVSSKLTKPDKFDPVYNISGNEFIDLPAIAVKEYIWEFFCYKECSLTFQVFFTNEETKEYLFYEICLQVVKNTTYGIINITTHVRQPEIYELTLKNPLKSNVNFSLTINCPEVTSRSPVNIEPECESIVPLRYNPVFPGNYSATLDVTCPELGTYTYELELEALTPKPEALIQLSAALGESASTEVSIENITKSKATYNCQVENEAFDVKEQLVISAHSKSSVKVIFEPVSLGCTNTCLKITSATGGDFEFPIVGTCKEPYPKGPVFIKYGYSSTIHFKNVFSKTKKFSVRVTNPAFMVKNEYETIKPKKVAKITLFSLQDSTEFEPEAGKLIIKCESDEELSNIQWIYYVKSELPGSKTA